jgi:hypothetical protein
VAGVVRDEYAADSVLVATVAELPQYGFAGLRVERPGRLVRE